MPIFRRFDMERNFVSIADFAKRYAIGELMVRRHVAAGDIPAVRVGRVIRIDLAAAESAFLKPAIGA